MKSFVVYAPNGSAPHTQAGADSLVFVKEGFSWGAFLLTLPWLLWRRAWLGLAVWIAAMVAVGVLTWLGIGQFPEFLLSVLVGLMIGFEAPWFRSLALRQRGFRPIGIASGRSELEAEQAFFPRWLADRDTGPREPVVQQPTYAPRPRSAVSPALGVFPEPETRR